MKFDINEESWARFLETHENLIDAAIKGDWGNLSNVLTNISGRLAHLTPPPGVDVTALTKIPSNTSGSIARSTPPPGIDVVALMNGMSKLQAEFDVCNYLEDMDIDDDITIEDLAKIFFAGYYLGLGSDQYYPFDKR